MRPPDDSADGHGWSVYADWLGEQGKNVEDFRRRAPTAWFYAWRGVGGVVGGHGGVGGVVGGHGGVVGGHGSVVGGHGGHGVGGVGGHGGVYVAGAGDGG